MGIAEELSAEIGVSAACRVLELPRSSLYRRRQPTANRPVLVDSAPVWPSALAPSERQTVLEVLHSPRFVDKAPAEVCAQLLDEGVYLCSERTMYRLLGAEKEVRERRNQLQHPPYSKPQLLATAPNQVWSWDITKLPGPQKWTHYYLYVILDIYSRYVVGWMLAHRESADLAQRLIRETVQAHDIAPGELIIHSDRGPSMQSLTVGQLLATLGVTRSFTRPYTPTDNPYSESTFRTFKYHPQFPSRFEGGFEQAHGFCGPYFHWYNYEHCHSGIALLPPATVHFGRAPEVLAQRQQVLDAAFAAHPERFRKRPQVAALPAEVWINGPPKMDACVAASSEPLISSSTAGVGDHASIEDSQ